MAFRSQPSQLGRVLLCRQPSYLSFVPPRFGHVAALDDAFRCLATAAHATMVATGQQYIDKVLVYYGTALQSLQSAVDNPRERQKPEVLCAVCLLALFEVRATRGCGYVSTSVSDASRGCWSRY